MSRKLDRDSDATRTFDHSEEADEVSFQPQNMTEGQAVKPFRMVRGVDEKIHSLPNSTSVPGTCYRVLTQSFVWETQAKVQTFIYHQLRIQCDPLAPFTLYLGKALYQDQACKNRTLGTIVEAAAGLAVAPTRELTKSDLLAFRMDDAKRLPWSVRYLACIITSVVCSRVGFLVRSCPGITSWPSSCRANSGLSEGSLIRRLACH